MINDKNDVKKQYENSGNLATRISIHDKYSTNKTAFSDVTVRVRQRFSTV